MTRDQFLGMVSPLFQLKELNLKSFSIKKIYKKRLYTKLVQLPPSLTKLTIGDIYLIDNPELFVQTINSHNNLVNFNYKTYTQCDLLELFYKNYSSLKFFGYTNQQLNPQNLFDIFKFNPQLITLKLNLTCWNNALTDHISTHLVNLEEFNFEETRDYRQDDYTIQLKFCRPTKIKKLKLGWESLSQSSLESILMNSPELEDLSLNCYHNFIGTDPQISITLFKPTKINKLEIICNNLSENSLNSILTNYPQLKSLDIQLYKTWKE